MFSNDETIRFLRELKACCAQWKGLANVNVSSKKDHTPVTIIDQGLSDFFKEHPLKPHFHFYSEEDHDELLFPGLILDPLDGTRDFIQGRAECAISAAWMKGPLQTDESFALIHNPFSGFTLTSHDLASWEPRAQAAPFYGMVSRSEWEQGLFPGSAKDFSLSPRGSIAFKLGLLSSGACDFVISRRPKNIWDIAAGTLLAWQRGMEFWSGGKKVTSLVSASYAAPMFWAPPEIISSLRAAYP